jgi:polysaccharide export outer membrane protein
MRPDSTLLAVALAALSTACPPALGPYVWFDQYRSSAQAAGAYVVTAGDLINVRVYNQDAMSAKVRVRADGRISLPFLGDIDAAGLPPTELSKRLQTLLKEFVVNPVVTVSLEEPRALEVYVAGEVARPGRYPLEPTASVLQAIAAAGGPTAFASPERIFVLRREPRPVRIRFQLEALTRNEKDAASFRLLGGDTVVVE